MLAWRDEWTPVDLKRCWSERIRADLRTMQGTERENWTRILYSIHGDESTRPAPKWIKETESIVQKIGSEAFRDRLIQWLAPLGRGVIQKLSREGSFLLRSFVWLAQISKASNLIARLPEIGGVEFKPKANGQKVIRAVADAAGLPDPTCQPPTAALRFEDLAARALSVALSPATSPVAPALAGRVEVGADVVYVRGNLDSYEIHIANGAIFRRSDGRRVKIVGSMPQFVSVPLPGFAAVTDLVQHVLILAEDDTNSRYVISTSGE